MVGSEAGPGSAAGIDVSGQPSVEIDASGWAVVALRGEQDVFEARRSRSALMDALAAGRGRVVVDLSEVTFSDSSLLGALVAAVKEARRHSHVVCVVTADERFAQKLRITGLGRVVHLFPTLSDALAGRS